MLTIRFYQIDKPYGCFSNFSRHEFEINGLLWPTTEHYFQASKFIHEQDREAVRSASTPFLAAQLGRDRNREMRPDWDTARIGVMRQALAAKFNQHADLRDILISTGDCTLIEHTSNDSYWADGGDGKGQNKLGVLLMELRHSYSPNPEPFFLPPWVQYPDIAVSDLFWRMGSGEDYLCQYLKWRSALPISARTEYDSYFKVPSEWSHSQ